MSSNVYHLYAKEDGFWHWLGNIYAETYDQAHRQAITTLEPRFLARPIRLEYDADAPSNRAILIRGGCLPPEPPELAQ